MYTTMFMGLLCQTTVLRNVLQVDPQCTNVSDIRAMDPNYGVTWMFFPDGQGNPQIIDLTNPEPTSRTDPKYIVEDPDSKINMYLYTKKNKGSPKKIKIEKDDLRKVVTLSDDYNGNNPTKILIHGWKSNSNDPVIQLIKDAYLDEIIDANIIAVDWKELANENYYFKSARSTRDVGQNIAAVIDHMIISENASLRDIHVIGHSLGAHTAGYSGSYTRSGKIGRITGLDPALPGFQDTNNSHQKLDPSDAQFVDIIHTCGRANQPGCEGFPDFVGACSHGRSYEYFAESIRSQNGFMAVECPTWEEYKNKHCNKDPIRMGESVPKSARGTYFLETGSGPISFARNIKLLF